MVRSSALSKSLSNKITFLIRLENDYSNLKTVIFSLSYTQIHKFHFQLMDTFFHCLSPFWGFFSQSDPYSEDHLFLWFLETQGPTICSLYGLLLLSRAPQYSIDATVFKSFISSSVCIKIAKISYKKKDIFHSAPLTKLTRTPDTIGKFRSHQKILFAFE